jgi:hypothetical protein
MNVDAHELALRWLDELGNLPGAHTMSIHTSPQQKWALLLIMASSDRALVTLSEKFDLTPEDLNQDGRCQRTAVGNFAGGSLRFRIAGPLSSSRPRWNAVGTGHMATARVRFSAEEVLEAARTLGLHVVDPVTGRFLRAVRP